MNYDEWAALSAETREKMSDHNTRIQKAGDALAKMGWAEGRWRKKTKPSDNPAQRYLTAVKEKRKKWEPKRKHDRTMVTRSQEDAESDDFDDEVILLTKSYRDAVCLMTTCSPILELNDDTRMLTLNPEGVHQPPTRGIEVSDDIVSPERGSRGSPPLSICSLVMGCSDIAHDIVSPEMGSRGSPPESIAIPELVDMSSDDESDDVTDVTPCKQMNSPWDRSIKPVNQSQLRVRESVYRAVNDHRYIVPVGRCLTCAVEVKKRQEIGMFVGNTVSSQDVTLMSPARGSYLLDIYQPI